MAKRLRRKGETVTFSVSVDRETKKLLREVADRTYRGNVSDVITQIAHQAARQEAAGELLLSHGRRPMTDAECDAFEADVAAQAGPVAKKKRRSA
jgi:hypothetical protein